MQPRNLPYFALRWTAIGIALAQGLGELVVLQRWRLRQALHATRGGPTPGR